MTMVNYGWLGFIMVDHSHGCLSLTMLISLCWVKLIMFNHSLLWHYYIAMLIMVCSSHCDIKFCLLHCDIRFFSSHEIIRFWSSNYDDEYLFVTLWHCKRFLIVSQWVMLVTLWRREMFVSSQCWSMFLTLPHWVLYITLQQWVVFVPLRCLEISVKMRC
jgi:hypothetical protein